jgi:cytochrome o ubiquinol oxidase subunit II
MNSFFIPQLDSQVYAMVGMQTQLHLIANSTGTYSGLSSAFSGPGFSDMHFDTDVTSGQKFDAWIKQARKSGLILNDSTYTSLALPSAKAPVTVYADVEPGLFEHVVDQYMPAHASMPPADQQPISTKEREQSEGKS